jgi:predicted Zn finger-like uncharacterized protein
MLIVCPNCATAYEVTASTLGVEGRAVRCAKCHTQWFAHPADVTAAVTDVDTAAVPTVPSPKAGSFPPPDNASEPTAHSEEPEDHFTVDEIATANTEMTPAAEGDSAPAHLAEAPSIVPPQGEEPAAPTNEGKFNPSLPDDVEPVPVRRPRKSRRQTRAGTAVWLKSGLPGLILGLVAVLASLVHWRASVVRYAPQTAPVFAAIGLPVNLRGLDFEGVKSTNEFHEGIMVLVVEGNIVNITHQTAEVPRLRFAVRNSVGHEVYAWTALPKRTLLSPGERLEFRTRLASPPADGRDVIVRFFNRRDATAGGQ